MAKIGIIGGSGLYDIEGIEITEEVVINDTLFGPPSGHFKTGRMGKTEVVFLARHGKGHHISPSHVNYRANIFEMKRLGVDAILSVSACGSLKEDIKPLDFIVPDQFVDRTFKARETSFFTDGIVAHVSMAEPVSKELSSILIKSGRTLGLKIHEKGTYINMEGPQFSTKAESNLYRSWGMDIIGMTNMIEAKLAREAEIAYASLCSVTDFDCWHPHHDEVTVDMIIENLTKNVKNSKEIIKLAIPEMGRLTKFEAQNSLKYAIITHPDHIPEQKKIALKPIIGKYIQ
ncbi:MAG: S-methyl-5'-thioadenosine phosphorylase [Candidatus Omnitrophica bacterium]|nr:S-methyl-5'-thioadenosine phosphorylase [Candidatus Omnitrophota bacterium]